MGDMRDRGDNGHRADGLTWLTWPTVLIDLPHTKRDSLSEWPPTSLLLVLGGLWGPQVSAHISRLLTTTIPIKYHFAGEGEAPHSPASASETVSRKPATVQGLKQWMIEFVISYICWRWRTQRCWRWCRHLFIFVGKEIWPLLSFRDCRHWPSEMWKGQINDVWEGD